MFKADLVYRLSSRTVRIVLENLSQKRSIGSKRTKEDARACAGVCVGGQDMQSSVDRDGLMHWPIPS